MNRSQLHELLISPLVKSLITRVVNEGARVLQSLLQQLALPTSDVDSNALARAEAALVTLHNAMNQTQLTVDIDALIQVRLRTIIICQRFMFFATGFLFRVFGKQKGRWRA